MFIRRTTALAAMLTLATGGCGNDKSTVATPGASNFADQAADISTAKAGTTLSAQAMQQPEVAALFTDGPMPTGVAVDHFGRVFVNYPRWADNVAYSVAEIVDGKAAPYPDDQITQLKKDDPAHSLVSVQSVVTDGTGRLWIVDTGSINFAPVIPGVPKLVAVSLRTNRVVKTIPIPPDVCLPTSYLNDVRFDMGRGKGGTAYLTDSSSTGPNAIIVVDLDSGRCLRRLNDHPSTKIVPNFFATVEGKPVHAKVGADGIALSPDGRTLYYCPLSSSHLYSVDAHALSDAKLGDDAVAATVDDLGDKGFVSDGLICDDWGNLYMSDCENDAIRVCRPDRLMSLTMHPGQGRGSVPDTGSWEFLDANGEVTRPAEKVLASDARMLWPDSMSIGIVAGGDPDTEYLYVICDQLERLAAYQNGTDERVRPFVLFRMKVNAGPSHPGAKMAVPQPEENRSPRHAGVRGSNQAGV